jgi:hypothetical protein
LEEGSLSAEPDGEGGDDESDEDAVTFYQPTLITISKPKAVKKKKK